MEKKLGNINAHVPLEIERKIRRIAELDGMSASEYVSRLISEHLSRKEHEVSMVYEALFGDSSNGSRGSE